MKKKLLFLIIPALFFGKISPLPNEFFVIERFLSFSSAFDITTELEPFAVARKELFSFTSSFELVDRNECLLASSSSRFFSWGMIADVMDPEGRDIGRIEEEVFRIFPWCEYKVFNETNQLVAIARMDFLGTEFEIFPPSNEKEVYATISRPLFRFFRDYWTVKINDLKVFEENLIDPRILIILAIYQSDKDNRDHYRKLFLENLRNELDAHEEHRIE